MRKEIQKLEAYFFKRKEILFAFLFGSQAEKRAGRISDWDIAVYFKPKQDAIELEETDLRYPQEDRIWLDLTNLLETDNIDLVVLNRAPSNIAASAISGILLSLKDRAHFLEFILIVTREAEDYHKFANDYYEISERSMSISVVDREKLRRIASFLQEEMSLYAYFSSFVFKDYQDIHKRHEVERWVENMINAGIDIGKIILASKKVKIPAYYSEVFMELDSIAHFKDLDLERFAGWVKLRNILAHEYLDIKWKRIEEFIKESPPYFKQFLARAKRFSNNGMDSPSFSQANTTGIRRE